MAGNPSSKIRRLKAAMQGGHWRLALRIAARFPRLGTYKTAIVRAHEAYSNARFYRQLGYDSEQLKAAGRRALIKRYGK